ncbi:hypothetical protein Emag_000099 [Eimeria magna]
MMGLLRSLGLHAKGTHTPPCVFCSSRSCCRAAATTAVQQLLLPALQQQQLIQTTAAGRDASLDIETVALKTCSLLRCLQQGRSLNEATTAAATNSEATAAATAAAAAPATAASATALV